MYRKCLQCISNSYNNTTYLSQQNDKGSFWVLSNICVNTIFLCLAVCYSQMHGRTIILKLWLHNNNKWLNNKNSSIRLMQTRHCMFAT